MDVQKLITPSRETGRRCEWAPRVALRAGARDGREVAAATQALAVVARLVVVSVDGASSWRTTWGFDSWLADVDVR